MHIPGYKLNQSIYQSNNSIVYRGQRETDNLAVIIKILNTEFPTSAAVARFKLEHSILKSLDIRGVIKSYAFDKDQNIHYLVNEDINGESLSKILKNKSLNFEEFLTISIKITDILATLHQNRIIHKDINPANIIWNQTSEEIKLIDFGISSKLHKEQPEII